MNKKRYRVIKENENVNFHIDIIQYIEIEKKVIIQGWAFSQTNVNLITNDVNIESSIFSNTARPDVKDHFKLNNDLIGFNFEARLKKYKKNIKIILVDENNQEVVLKIKLEKHFNLFRKKNVEDFIIYKNEHGYKATFKHVLDLITNKTPYIIPGDINSQYNALISKEKNLDVEKMKNDIKKFKYTPLISIVVPVYNVPEKWLKICIDSVIDQSYSNWELCLIDDASPADHVKVVLKEYEEKDKRIKVKYRTENGHISVASNDGIQMANGEFIALLDNDDELTPDALYEMVKLLNKNKDLDMIYSDEDKITIEGKLIEPHFKPDWSPETFMSNNYICHFTILRASIVKEIGGFRKGYEGAQDYDLFLRFTEKTSKIAHISKVLYHWRMLETSTASNADSKDYAHDAGKDSLEDALKRRGLKGEIEQYKNSYITKYTPLKEDLISIIIPTKDHPDVLEVCLNSIYKKTTYKNFEIIIVNNGSVDSKTFELFDEYKLKHENFRVIDINTEFNYSYLNNEAVKISNGEYILLLNNDIEVITEDWLENMLGYAQLEHIGAVGAKLLYPDNTVQHCGVVRGMLGLAGHIYKGASLDNDGYFCRLKIPFNYGAVTAACLMVKKEKYLEVNGLDEQLKVAFNDIDFNIKLTEKKYYNVVLPQVMLYHYESKSRGLEDTPEKVERFNGEIQYMYKKWKKKLKFDPFYNDHFDLETDQISIKLNKNS